MRKVLCLALCAALFTWGATAQTSSPGTASSSDDKDRVARSLEALKQGNLAETDMDWLARKKAVEAIPDLKKQFWITEDESNKNRIANALMRLGDKDPAWWNYLSEKAADAVNSDAPSEQQFDANGKLIAGPSPNFLAWAKVHSLTPEQAEQRVQLDALAVLALGEAEDRRAIPLLRQGLLSANYLIQAYSALGLAHLQDKESIRLIISACDNAPADTAFVIASALLDFNTPEAQSAAKRFRPPQPPASSAR